MRLLDLEETRFPFDADTQNVSERFRSILATVLLRPDLPRQSDPDAAARDVMAIIKGLVDTAGAHGETDQHVLSIRVSRAVFGYLRAWGGPALNASAEDRKRLLPHGYWWAASPSMCVRKLTAPSSYRGYKAREEPVAGRCLFKRPLLLVRRTNASTRRRPP